MAHRAAILTRALAVGSRLGALLVSVVPFFNETSRLHGGNLDELAPALRVLRVPRHLLDEGGRVLLFLHIIMRTLLN
jgi:hypothetical protein